MTVCIIYTLKIIDIHHENGKRSGVSLYPCHFAVKGPAVTYLCKTVNSSGTGYQPYCRQSRYHKCKNKKIESEPVTPCIVRFLYSAQKFFGNLDITVNKRRICRGLKFRGFSVSRCGNIEKPFHRIGILRRIIVRNIKDRLKCGYHVVILLTIIHIFGDQRSDIPVFFKCKVY